MYTHHISFPSYLFLFLLIGMGSAYTQPTQEVAVTETYTTTLIQQLTQELTDRYVFPELAEKAAQHLDSLHQAGHFNPIDDLSILADSLTAAIYTICQDKHLSVSLRKAPEEGDAEVDPFENWMANRMEERAFYRRYNANFKSVTKMDGNIGYLDLRGFYGLSIGRTFADHAMAMLATSDAIVIDLRNNSGGRGDMVEYLLAHFFDQPIIASKSRKRNGDTFTEKISMTPAFISGKKMPNVPLFILTSSTTFSAAEGFSYPLQVYKRATFIGEVTKGGANPGDLIPLNRELQVFISDVSVTHPLTNSSWEGVGIIPDIPVDSEKALEVALPHATEAAETYRAKMEEKAKAALLALNETIANFDGNDNQLIVDAYLTCKQYDVLFEEWELNALGYQLLTEESTQAAAEAVLETNTVLYPYSANTFDSYAEALLKNGKRTQAIAQYEKAVSLAEEFRLDKLELFQENLEKAKER